MHQVQAIVQDHVARDAAGRRIGYHAGEARDRFTHLREGMLARVKKLTEAMTKTQMFSDIAEKTELTRRQNADVYPEARVRP